MGYLLSLLMSNFLYLFLKVSYSQSFPPPLSAAEESECFRRMRGGDREAREKLIRHNLRLVAHIVKKYYGKSLSQVINDEKLGYASYLLTATSLPISDVAIQSNFHSDNYFFQKFKDHFGETPLQYRKSSVR